MTKELKNYLAPIFVTYTHHGNLVWVNQELKGLHREHCLCYSCERFFPGESSNCPIAQELFNINVKHGITTPVFECPEFKEGQRE